MGGSRLSGADGLRLWWGLIPSSRKETDSTSTSSDQRERRRRRRDDLLPHPSSSLLDRQSQPRPELNSKWNGVKLPPLFLFLNFDPNPPSSPAKPSRSRRRTNDDVPNLLSLRPRPTFSRPSPPLSVPSHPSSLLLPPTDPSSSKLAIWQLNRNVVNSGNLYHPSGCPFLLLPTPGSANPSALPFLLLWLFFLRLLRRLLFVHPPPPPRRSVKLLCRLSWIAILLCRVVFVGRPPPRRSSTAWRRRRRRIRGSNRCHRRNE